MNKNNYILGINVFFDTLGCAKNTVDTTKMEAQLVKKGLNVVDDVNDADVIVLNTCAFIKASAEESIETFFQYRNYYIDKKIVVVGCLVSRYKDDLIKELHEADAFLSCKDESKLYDTIKSLNINPKNRTKVLFDNNSNNCVYSYVKISEGCNRFCSYCSIPYIRGKYQSSSYEEIKNDVEHERAKGSREIVLVAQDCGVWGSDFKEKKNLAWFLKNLSSDFSDLFFRVLYIQPDAINTELLDCIKEHDNIRNYLDIPIQHCNERILKLMNRKGSPDSYKSLISNIRNVIPDCCIRTTLIAGFPGEGENDFDELCNFLEEVCFDYAGCFEYSQEEGTKAASLSDQISSSTKYERANLLSEISDRISINKLNERIGKKYNVLIEGIEDKRYYGRAYFQAPDVDGYVYLSEFSDMKNVKIGDIVNVKIVDTEMYDLVGVLE